MSLIFLDFDRTASDVWAVNTTAAWPMPTFNPTDIRYIKLGSKDVWADALEAGELRLGHAAISHEICQAGDWPAVTALFVAAGRTARKAADFTRELRDFYSLGPDCLWITFAQGHLWWAFAAPMVEALAGGARRRRVIGAWSSLDLHGQPLRRDQLSSQLTSVASYQQTICQVKASASLLARIRAEEGAALTRARVLRAELVGAAAGLIVGLHQDDFETLVDLIFARSGWQRASTLGGIQKDIDLDVYEPLMGTRGLVQVKSRAGQKVLDDYIARFDGTDADAEIFFVCHSPSGTLAAPGRSNVHIWTGDKLAEAAVKAGLFDWLMQRSA
jgi:hypothetical protein